MELLTLIGLLVLGLAIAAGVVLGLAGAAVWAADRWRDRHR